MNIVGSNFFDTPEDGDDLINRINAYNGSEMTCAMLGAMMALNLAAKVQDMKSPDPITPEQVLKQDLYKTHAVARIEYIRGMMVQGKSDAQIFHTLMLTKDRINALIVEARERQGL